MGRGHGRRPRLDLDQLRDITVGYNGGGSLSITNGGTVSSTWRNSYVGYSPVGGHGHGRRPRLDLDQLLRHYVGYYGSGSLSITNGGAVSNTWGNSYIGYSTGSSGAVNVDGTGSRWTNGGSLYIGGDNNYDVAGSLSITNGGAVSSVGGYIGYGTGSSGAVTVDGPGSIWANSGSLYIGGDNNYGGAGTLSIANGGAVSVTTQTYVGWTDGSTGAIQFGANGGTLTTQGIFVSPAQLSGAGTINARGLVSDIDLRFDSAHPLNQSIPVTELVGRDGYGQSRYERRIRPRRRSWRLSRQRFAYDSRRRCRQLQQRLRRFPRWLDRDRRHRRAGSAWNNSNQLCVGYSGNGNLSIVNGGYVSNSNGYIAVNAWSAGKVTVDGSSSTWNNGWQVVVGNSGSGTLSVSNGGNVTGYFGYIGYCDGSTGLATVDGAGSTWTANYGLYVGGGYSAGTGTLSITNGGTVNNNGYPWASNYIGCNTGSTGIVTVNGAGSAWATNCYLNVGYNGCGTLSITGGGSASGGSAYLGCASGATGLVSVDGANSTWNNLGDLYVGNSTGASGTISISNGGSVSVAGTAYVGWNGSGGVVRFAQTAERLQPSPSGHRQANSAARARSTPADSLATSIWFSIQPIRQNRRLPSATCPAKTSRSIST